jgi:hypothetical protein
MDNRPLFFFSFAHQDSSPQVAQFFDNLAEQTRRLTATRPDQVGYRDKTSIDAEREWSQAHLEALSTARCFVCLYSRAYFKSKFCGKEWYLFHQRWRQSPSETPPPLIIPVIWAPWSQIDLQLPDEVRQIQLFPSAWGDEYAKRGVSQLMHMELEAYHQFLAELAETVVKRVEQFELPPLENPPAIEQIPNIFASMERDSASSPTPQPGIWITSGNPKNSDTLDLNNLTVGRSFKWALPEDCRKDDFVFFYVAGGPGFRYLCRVADNPTAAQKGSEFGPRFGELSVRGVFNMPITISMLKDDPVLKDWGLVTGNMQGVIRRQKESLLESPHIYHALRKLVRRHNPEAAGVLAQLDPQLELIETERHFISDQPTAEDHIGYGRIVSALAEFLQTTKTELPLVVGIDAPWGTGKSSLMRMLQRRLQPDITEQEQAERKALESGKATLNWVGLFELLNAWRKPLAEPKLQAPNGDRQFETVYFNAWRHGTGTRLTASLVHHVMNTIANRQVPAEREKLWLKLNLARLDVPRLRRKLHAKVLTGTVAGVFVLAGLFASAVGAALLTYFRESLGSAGWLGVVLGVLGVGLVGLAKYLPNVSKAVVSFDVEKYLRAPDYASLIGPDQEIERDFRQMLKQLEADGKTLAVFVDDLDRCSPPETAAVVEAINVFFGQTINTPCVFVVGMHRDLVATSLELAYQGLVKAIENTEHLAEELPFGQRFLEKIMQFVVRLPEPDEVDMKRYVAHITGGSPPKALSADDTRQFQMQLQSEEQFLQREDEIRDKLRQELQQTKGLEKEQAEEVSNQLVDRARVREIARTFNEKSQEVVRVFYLVRPALRSNPRQFKRFFNALRFAAILEGTQRDVRQDLEALLQLAKRVVISIEWPVLATVLARGPNDFQKLLNAASNGRKLADLVNDLGPSASWVKQHAEDGRFISLLAAEPSEPDEA